jgi:hypothetical protein
LVTAVTALVTVGWVAAVTPLIVPVRPDSAPAVWLSGFGPAAAAGCAGVVWELPCRAPVTVDAALVAAGCAPAATWLTVLVTLATGDVAAAAGWLECSGWPVPWPPVGCAAAGWLAAGWLCGADPWLLPRPWVTLLTVPATLLTAPATPLGAGGGELVAWLALLVLAAGGGAAGLAGFGWLAGCAALGWAGAGWAGAD